MSNFWIVAARSFNIDLVFSGKSQKSFLEIMDSISASLFSLSGRSKITFELFDFHLKVTKYLFEFCGHVFLLIIFFLFKMNNHYN